MTNTLLLDAMLSFVYYNKLWNNQIITDAWHNVQGNITLQNVCFIYCTYLDNANKVLLQNKWCVHYNVACIVLKALLYFFNIKTEL